jgi:NitT/TauT family transport system substrate-binding protein
MAAIKLGLNSGTGRVYAGPTLIALHRGYFEAEDLEIEQVPSGGRRGTIPMMAAGELDVAPQGISLELAQAWDRERPMIMAADHGSGGGGGSIVARPALVESGQLGDYADLRGKRIALSPIRGDHDWWTFACALKRGGLTMDDVEVVICDFGDARHRGLAEGTIDLATVGRPSSVEEGRRSGAYVVWKRASEVEPPRQGRTVLMGYAFWAERRDEAVRYLQAYLRGLRDYHDAFARNVGRDAVIDALADESGESREVVAGMPAVQVDPNGYVKAPSIGETLDWYAALGALRQEIPTERLVDHGLLEEALGRVGRFKAAS